MDHIINLVILLTEKIAFNSSMKKVSLEFHFYKSIFYYSWDFQKIVICFQTVFWYGNITNYIINEDVINMVLEI